MIKSDEIAACLIKSDHIIFMIKFGDVIFIIKSNKIKKNV